MCATFNGNPCTMIVSSYCLINASDETDITIFYNKLAQHILKHNIPINEYLNN